MTVQSSTKRDRWFNALSGFITALAIVSISILSVSCVQGIGPGGSTTPLGSGDNSLKIDITGAPNSNNWEPQIEQTLPDGIVAGTSYVLKFRAKASSSKTIVVQVNTGSDNGYRGFPDPNTVALTTDWKDYSMPFTADITDSTMAFQISVGANGLFQTYFDNISFTKADGTGEQIKNGTITSTSDWKVVAYSGAATIYVVDSNGAVIVGTPTPTPPPLNVTVVQRAPLFKPVDGKVLFFVGQDNDTIGGFAHTIKGGSTDGANTGYMSDTSLVKPAGFVTYTAVSTNNGTTSFTEYGAGAVFADQLTTYFSSQAPYTTNNLLLAIGYDLTQHLSETAFGTWDAKIIDLANWIKAKNYPVFLRIGYEFDGSWNAYDAANYKIAFQRVVKLFVQANVKNCAFVWQSTGWESAAQCNDYYPGDEYVDWAGYSNFNGSGTNMLAFATAHNKPVMICESTPLWGSTPNQGNLSNAASTAWTNWFSPLFGTQLVNNPAIQGFCYINTNWPGQSMWVSNDFFKLCDARVEKADSAFKINWNNELQKSKWITGNTDKNAAGLLTGWPIAP